VVVAAAGPDPIPAAVASKMAEGTKTSKNKVREGEECLPGKDAVLSLGFRMKGLRFRVHGLGFKALGVTFLE
jgi:hypothetical protein